MKILIIGHARHGKDTLMEIWEEFFTHHYFCHDTSWFCAKTIIFDRLKEKYNYQTVDDCYTDRGNHRKEWFDLINEYNDNEKDQTRLVREYLKLYDFYVGLRNKEQLEQCKEEKLFDLIIWVDASQRVKLESEESCTIVRDMADIVVENNGSYEEFKEKAIRLGKMFFNSEEFKKTFFSKMSTLKEFIIIAMSGFNETWEDIVFHTLNEDELNQKDENLPSFTIWSNTRIYFPMKCSYYDQFDNADYLSEIESVPRNPCNEKIKICVYV